MSAGQLRTPEIGCADAFSVSLDIAAASRADTLLLVGAIGNATARSNPPSATAF